MSKVKLTYLISILLALLALLPCYHCFAQDNSPELQKNSNTVDGVVSAKFAIVSDNTSLWSNDGTSVNGSEPESSIEIKIDQDRYDIKLGMPPMKPIFYDLVAMYPNTKLKTWMDTGNGFVPYPDKELSGDELSELDDQKYPVVQDKPQQKSDAMAYNTPRLIRNPEIIKNKIEKKKHNETELSAPESPDDRFKHRYMQRAGKDGKFPQRALLKAKEHIDVMWENQPKDAGLWEWEWLGPGNIGGRIRAILIHPNDPDKMWIGGASGGIWKSTNSGSSWQPVNDFLPSLNITSFVMDPNDYDVMYAATGEGFGNSWPDVPGAGIFKSTDGGNHWYQLPATDADTFNWVTRLANHPENSNILYATARVVGTVDDWDGKVYKSEDGGETWETILINTNTKAYDVKLKPGDPTTVIVGMSNSLWISEDSGAEWDERTTGNPDELPPNAGRCEIAVCPNQPNRIYVSMQRNGGEIWRSDDSGEEWTLMNSGQNYFVGISNQGWYDNAIWVSPLNSNLVVVGGIDLWRSTNGGDTLVKISNWVGYHNGGAANSAHCDQHIIIEHPDFDGVNNNTVYFGNDGGIQMTNDITAVTQNTGWTNLANNLGITQFYAGGASPDGSVIVGGTQDNSYLVYKSEDGIQNWYQANTNDGGYGAVNYNDSDTLFAEHQNLDFERSTDGGLTWNNARTGLIDAGNCTNFIAPFSMDPNDPGILVAGGCSIWRTTNAATNWGSIRVPIVPIGGVFCNAIDIAQGNSSIIWVGYTNGNVAFTDNTGVNWNRVDNNGANPLPNSRWVTDIAINPNDHDEIFVTFSGYNADNVWYTSDGGDNWTQASGIAPYDLPELQVNTIRYHPLNASWIYIGTDLGIFASENKGDTWSTTPRYENNEGPVNVEVDELFWAGDELIAATHGRGMFKSRPFIAIYVDKNAPPGGDGSWTNPFNNVTDAVNAAGHGTNIYIFDGNYSDAPILLNKRGYIQGLDGSVIIE